MSYAIFIDQWLALEIWWTALMLIPVFVIWVVLLLVVGREKTDKKGE